MSVRPLPCSRVSCRSKAAISSAVSGSAYQAARSSSAAVAGSGGNTGTWATDDELIYTRVINIALQAQFTSLVKDSGQNINRPISLQETIQVRNPEAGLANGNGPGDNSQCGIKMDLRKA